MTDLIFQLKINGKPIGKVAAKPDQPREDFVKYVQGIASDFDATRDTLEIIDVTPPETNKLLQHPARSRLVYDNMISRHLSNLVATYGEERVLKLIQDVYGLVQPETKAG